jgi:hypothetical protein
MYLKMRTNKRGSYILESAISLPVFIIAVMVMSSVILMYACIEDCNFIAANELRRGAAECAIADTSISVPYRLKKEIQGKHSKVASMRLTDSGIRTERWGVDELIADLQYLDMLKPEMIGIGPFIPADGTPFAGEQPGDVETVLLLISILRLRFPKALIPATTALATLCTDGTERGILAGANVVMPNLSPVAARKKYEIYENKICTGEESAQCRGCLEMRVKAAGYRVVTDRGDVRRK